MVFHVFKKVSINRYLYDVFKRFIGAWCWMDGVLSCQKINDNQEYEITNKKLKNMKIVLL